MSTTYNFSYKDRNGLLSPVTIDEWATMTLSTSDLAEYNAAKGSKEQFTFNPTTYFVEKKFPYGSSQGTTPLRNSNTTDFTDIDSSTAYKLHNFTSFLVEASLAEAVKRFNIDMSAIPADRAEGYKETLNAWVMMIFMYWIKYVSEDRPVDNIGELALKFNGSNATELGLDQFFPFLATTEVPFPDLDWEKWWDRFLADPNVIVETA